MTVVFELLLLVIIACFGSCASAANFKFTKTTESMPKSTVKCRTEDKWSSCQIQHLSYDVKRKEFFVNCCGSHCDYPELSNVELLGRPIDGMRPRIEVQCHKESYWSASYPNKKVIMLTHRYSPHNAGHLLMETALPLEKLAAKYGFVDNSDRVLLLNDDCYDGEDNDSKCTIHWFEGQSKEIRDRCTSNSRNILSPLARGSVYTYHDLMRQFETASGPADGIITFEQDVLAGIGSISPWSRGWPETEFNPVIDAYLLDAHSHFHVARAESARKHLRKSGDKRRILTFLHKVGRRSILNWQEIDKILAATAQAHGMHFVSLDLAETPFRKQLSVLASTSTLVTVGGSTAFSSFFLTPSNRPRVIYFPLLGNNFESHLLAQFPGRWQLVEYARNDGEWTSDVEGPVDTSDGSFRADVDVVKYLAGNDIGVPFATECPSLDISRFTKRPPLKLDALVRKIPIDLDIGVPYVVGAQTEYQHVAGWVGADKVNFLLYSAWWKQHSRSGGIALDLGANRGFYSYFFAALGIANVYSWEIETQMFKELRHGMTFNNLGEDRVHLNLIGLSNSNTFMAESGSGGSGFLSPASAKDATILALTLDCWAQTTGFNHKMIDIVKIDVEGFEMAALLGSSHTLFDDSVKLGALLMEVGPNRWSRSKIGFGTGVLVLVNLSKKFQKSSLILRSDSGCPQSISDGLNLRKYTWEGVELHEVQEEVWFPLMKKMKLNDYDCNFWFSN
eukprot:CAMPEP_0114440944 /NCGR_PEP_ID=MMETSP0103-20121206/16082_1 /TAXON_ID=37642 ORGANISM="Paraphysomonas imperforata, Strain PA2" /NCGR_SAMPLE_ID=MMETSP0103 /ASSEMBLY_ACC=CAM_ASM_000201 /LENGTH=732 /DNA_ID=CAMNT_0001611967 /DNA_START=17 /DNA_END=2215 /DNA_ORIENTATION=+